MKKIISAEVHVQLTHTVAFSTPHVVVNFGDTGLVSSVDEIVESIKSALAFLRKESFVHNGFTGLHVCGTGVGKKQEQYVELISALNDAGFPPPAVVFDICMEDELDKETLATMFKWSLPPKANSVVHKDVGHIKSIANVVVTDASSIEIDKFGPQFVKISSALSFFLTYEGTVHNAIGWYTLKKYAEVFSQEISSHPPVKIIIGDSMDVQKSLSEVLELGASLYKKEQMLDLV